MLELDWNIIINILNVFVFYLLMRWFLFKPINDIMEKRTNAIKESLAEAENRNSEALELKKEYEEALESADETAIGIIKEAKQRALEQHDKQIKATKEETLKMIEESNKAIQLEKKKSMQNIQSEIAGIAISAAAKVIQKNMDNSANNQIIDDFLAEAGAHK